MKTSAHSSTGTIFTSEPKTFGDEEHNLWNLLLGLHAHHTCRPVLQRGLCEEDLCKAALSLHFAVDVPTVGHVQMVSVSKWSGAQTSGG